MNLLSSSVVFILAINFILACNVPKAKDNQVIKDTLKISGVKDFGFVRIQLGKACAEQSEKQPAVLELADGAHIKNLIIGKNSGNGVICKGSCTFENVHWEDVCEDAATMESKDPKDTFRVIGGSATNAGDKVFQHNGNGNLMSIKNFCANNIGKLARSCGTCSGHNYPNRKFEIENVTVDRLNGTIVGLQENQNDRAISLKNIKVTNAKSGAAICKIYQYRNDGNSDPKHLRDSDGSDKVCSFGKDVKISN